MAIFSFFAKKIVATALGCNEQIPLKEMPEVETALAAPSLYISIKSFFFLRNNVVLISTQ